MTLNPISATDPRRRWLGLAMLSLGVAMIIVDATVVNVAVPSIARDLGLSGSVLLGLLFSLLLPKTKPQDVVAPERANRVGRTGGESGLGRLPPQRRPARVQSPV